MKTVIIRSAAFAAYLIFAATAAQALAQVPKTGPTPNPGVSIPPAMPPLVKREVFFSAGYLVPATVCGQFTTSNCSIGTRYGSRYVRGTAELPLGSSLTGMVKIDDRVFHYTGASGAASLTENEADVRAGIRVLEPRLYLAASYLRRTNDYGVPRLNAIGFGLEKLPDADQTFSLFGGAYYYPSVQGVYHELRYDVGASLKPSNNAPLFIELGYLGDHTRNAGTAPANEIRSGPYVGIGIALP